MQSALSRWRPCVQNFGLTPLPIGDRVGGIPEGEDYRLEAANGLLTTESPVPVLFPEQNSRVRARWAGN
jgi:hypothetical protein